MYRKPPPGVTGYKSGCRIGRKTVRRFDNVEAAGENVKSASGEVLLNVSADRYQARNDSDFKVKMEKLLVSYQGRKIYNPSLGREVEIKIFRLRTDISGVAAGNF